MQLRKFKVIERQAAQDFLDEEMQQEAVDLQELLDELRLQKELNRMCTELVGKQMTPEEFDTVPEQSAQGNCR